MAEAFNLLRRVKSLDISPEQPAYSGVVIFAGQDDEGNNIEYSAGDRTGTVLEITNEWGSQEQADAIYRKIRGYTYQPYRATGSQLDPSVEIGDAVTVNDTYGGVFRKTTSFGRYASTDIEAPSKEEVEHEFQIQSSTDRRFERFTRSVRASLSITASQIAAEVEDRQAADNLLRATLNVQAEQIYAEVEERKKSDESLRATLNVQAQQIEAKVSKEGGNTSSDFWWKLLSTGWDAGTGSKTVFSVKKNGAYVDGEIRATTGKIGGFDIQSNYLSYNGQTWGGTNTTGAYIGQSGIQLGKNFKVDMQGNLTASAGTFGGTIYCDELYVKNKSGGFDKVNTESMNANLDGGGAYRSSGWGNYSASKTWSGANYGLSYGNATNSKSGDYPQFFRSKILSCDTLLRNDRTLSSKVATINGEIVTLAIWR